MYEFFFKELLVYRFVKRAENVVGLEWRYFFSRIDKDLFRNMEVYGVIFGEVARVLVRMVVGENSTLIFIFLLFCLRVDL